jgi:stearoyl-CoA desaturase (Delta-9 desaturase)
MSATPSLPPLVAKAIATAGTLETGAPSKGVVVEPKPVHAAERDAATELAGLTREHVLATEHEPASKLEQAVTLFIVVVPLLGLGVAVWSLWGVGISWIHLALMGVFYVLTAGGITVGFHRYFTHKSYEAVRPVQFLIGVCGSMAAQGSILRWSGYHRRHHQHSDDALDPHSPHAYGGGVWGIIRGAWHAHVGWLFEGHPKGVDRYVVDLKKDPMIKFIDKLFVFWVVLGIVLPGIIAGLITLAMTESAAQAWTSALLGSLWAGFVRLFLVHHVTWSINSVCHIWGSRDFESHDESRNNPIFGILALGEGWHNNHHAFPASARHGLKWWQIDLSYIFIKTLSYVGLTRDVRVPLPERMEAKRRK